MWRCTWCWSQAVPAYNTSGVRVIASPSQILLSWELHFPAASQERIDSAVFFFCFVSLSSLSDTPSQIGKLDSSRKRLMMVSPIMWASSYLILYLPSNHVATLGRNSVFFVCVLFPFSFPLFLFLSKPTSTTTCNYAFLNIQTWLIWLRCCILFFTVSGF